ncbi:MAG TPA: peptide deformylase [Oligoflexia bacterium]|nr:peptide deformylase [Oligoflexia bacterium]HMP27905.1 peptide deformylase [Oligoflexia bacterium]
MTKLNIVIYPNPLLRQRALEIEQIDQEIFKLAEDMLETMYAAPGVGLAGPQVGILKRIFVADPSNEKNNPMIFINPVVEFSKDKITGEEGCLSIPGYYEKVSRSATVFVRAKDINGKQFELTADGLLSTIIQHELDHLNGVLFPDHLSILKRSLFHRWARKNLGAK